MHPREFHSIKKNILNVITVLDITNPNNLGFVSVTLLNLINRGFPFRFGLVPIIETEVSLKIARLLYWLNDAYGARMTMMFLKRVSSPMISFICGQRTESWLQVAYASPQQTTLDWDSLKQEFAKFLEEEKPSKSEAEADFDFITTQGTDIPLEKIQRYTKRLDISLGSTPDGEVFINGKPVEMSGVGWTPS